MSCYLDWLKCLPFLSGRVMIDFIVISGLIRLILRLGCKDDIVIVMSGISVYRGSVNWDFVPYILL